MSFRTETVDDLTGEPHAKPIQFSFEGVDYEIDLTQHNRQKLRDAFAPYVDAARRRTYRTVQLPRAERPTRRP